MGGSCSPEFVDYLLRQQLLDRLFGWKVRDPLLLFWALRFHAVILMDTDLLTLARAFDSDNKCREYLEDLRWPDGVRCTRCQSNKISHIAKRNQYDCDSCRYQFSVTAGSIFHDSHLPLWKWFAAVYLMCESEKGISASQVKRTLKVTHKTAWYLCHRIRAAMKEVNPKPLKGTVENDDTRHGGMRREMGEGDLDNKTTIGVGIERGRAIRLPVDGREVTKSVGPFLQKTTGPDTEHIYTDSAATFEVADCGTAEQPGVDHSAQGWVRGDVHTNSIEGAQSLSKRSVIGSYHQLTNKYLQSYVDEHAFRLNNRKNQFLFRDTLKRLLSTSPLPFEQLTKDNSA
jgi:transposase-like protein